MEPRYQKFSFANGTGIEKHRGEPWRFVEKDGMPAREGIPCGMCGEFHRPGFYHNVPSTRHLR